MPDGYEIVLGNGGASAFWDAACACLIDSRGAFGAWGEAFASVIFEELLEVECRIMEGKRGLWTAWPANNTSGGWKAEFVFEDKKLKKKVEESLAEKYKNFKNERK